jgi:hypothetical protein
MKYLRTYESLNSEEEFLKDIKDILLEVEDMGYITRIIESTWPKDSKEYVIWINIINKSLCGNYIRPIDFNEIKDCVLRIKDYLGNKFVGCLTQTSDNSMDGVWRNIDLGEDTTLDYEFRCLEISYNPYKI